MEVAQEAGRAGRARRHHARAAADAGAGKSPPAPVAAAGDDDGGTAATEPAKPLRSAADAELEKAGLKRLRVEVNGPLETAVVAAVGPELGPRLVQVLVRSLVWWLAVPNDLRRGDLLEALYEERAGEDPIIHAVRYKSGKNARTYKAYRYKPGDSQWPRFYTPDGAELELRLVHAPLDDYEQVTSLLRDGRGHKGVDFKTPDGLAGQGAVRGGRRAQELELEGQRQLDRAARVGRPRLDRALPASVGAVAAGRRARTCHAARSWARAATPATRSRRTCTTS